MTNIHFPTVNVPILSATTPQDNTDQKVLFIGQAIPAASAHTLSQNIPNSQSEIETLFGAGSMLSRMLIDARALNTICEFDAISLEEGSGATAPSCVITIAGTATDEGTITAVIESSRLATIEVAIPDTTTATVAGDLLSAAINENLEIAYSAVNVTGTITVTSDMNGEIGNSVSSAVSSDTAGLALTVVGFVTTDSGATDPDLTGALDLIGEERYQTIVSPYTSDIDTVKDFLDARFNAQDAVLDGIGVIAATDTFSNLLTLVSGVNSQSIAIIGDEFSTVSTSDESSAIFEATWSISSQFSSIRALRRQPGANISQFVISRNGALDSQGGPALSSKPYANTPLPLLPVVSIGRGFTRQEIINLNSAGLAVLGNNKSKSSIIAGQVVTTYLTDTTGNPDTSFKFMNYVDTASTGREYFFNNLQARYAQSRLTDGNLIQGRDMANKENIEAVMTGFYQVLADVDFVVARKGEDILKFFKDNLVVAIDLVEGKADITFSLPIVTQLREINAPMKLTFNID